MGRPPSEIRARTNNATGRQQVAFLERPGHWYHCPETDRAKAIQWARRNRDRLLGDPARRLKLEDLARDFYAPDGVWRRRLAEKGQLMSDRHLANQAAMLVRYILPAFGTRDPRELLGREIDDEIFALRRSNGRPLASATKYKIVRAFSVLLEDLVGRGILERNPLAGVRPFSKRPQQPRGAIPRDVLQRLFPLGHGPLLRVWGKTMWSAMALLFRDTGMRPGEARALRWADIYPTEGAVVVRRAVKSNGELGGTKTGVVRAGDLSAAALAELALWREESRCGGDEDLVFHTDGKAISSAGFREAMRAALKRIGCEGTPYTPYWIRHSFVTYALAALDAREVALLAGHSETIAQAVYSHPDDRVVIQQSLKARRKLKRSGER